MGGTRVMVLRKTITLVPLLDIRLNYNGCCAALVTILCGMSFLPIWLIALKMLVSKNDAILPCFIESVIDVGLSS
jgi:hypothetical protein